MSTNSLGERTVSFAPEDLAELAHQVVQGLREDLTEAIGQCLQNLQQEQGKSVLAAESAEHSPEILSRNFNPAYPSVPTWEPETLLALSASTCKSNQGESRSMVDQGRHGCQEPSFERTTNNQHQRNPERPHWSLSWVSDLLGTPSGVATLGNARDKELLADMAEVRAWNKFALQPGSSPMPSSGEFSDIPGPDSKAAPNHSWATMPANLEFSSLCPEMKRVNSDTCMAYKRPALKLQVRRRGKASKVLDLPAPTGGKPELSGIKDAFQDLSSNGIPTQESRSRRSRKVFSAPGSSMRADSPPCAVRAASPDQPRIRSVSLGNPCALGDDPPEKGYFCDHDATAADAAANGSSPPAHMPPRRRSLDAKAFISQPSDTRKMQLEREEELLSPIGQPCPPCQQSPEVQRRNSSPERNGLNLHHGALKSQASTSDIHLTPSQQPEEVPAQRVPGEGPPRPTEGAARAAPSWKDCSERRCAYLPGASPAQRAGTPVLLGICGILPWCRLGATYRFVMQLLVTGLVAIFVVEFYEAQLRMASHAECRMGVCLSFSYLSDIILAAGSLLGLLATRTLTSQELLGSPTALLVRFAREYGVVQKWSQANTWQTIYLAVLWVGSLAFRAATLPPEPGVIDVVRACAFMMSSLIFVGLVYSILYVSCLICSLLDTYADGIRATKDMAKTITEWDRLVALLRRVSRAVGCSFLLVQITSLIMLLCSLSDLLLLGRRQIWRFTSDALLAQTLVLLFFKAAEVTEYCTRLPSVVNLLDFQGNVFSAGRHYLVEHIAYSAAGFYVGEVRLTAAMALRLMYASILVAFGILSRLTEA